MNNVDNEYLMLRAEVENNLKRQENYFLVSFTLLSLFIGFKSDFSDYKILLLIIIVIFFLQTKIIKCRNTVYYVMTYLMVFLEDDDSNFNWENRFFRMQTAEHSMNNASTCFISEFTSTLKLLFTSTQHFVNLSMVLFLYIKILNMLPSTDTHYLLNSYFILSSIFLIANIACTLYICLDKNLKLKYIRKWEKLKYLELSHQYTNI